MQLYFESRRCTALCRYPIPSATPETGSLPPSPFSLPSPLSSSPSFRPPLQTPTQAKLGRAAGEGGWAAGEGGWATAQDGPSKWRGRAEQRGEAEQTGDVDLEERSS